MSDVFWEHFWVGLGTIISASATLIAVWLSHLRLSRQARDMHEENRKVTRKTYRLVNNNMTIQLRINAAALRRIAFLTKGTPSGERDAEIADAAEALLENHLRGQSSED